MPGFERFFGAPGADAILLYLADRAHAAVAEIPGQPHQNGAF
jgi:hypothetical protein